MVALVRDEGANPVSLARNRAFSQLTRQGVPSGVPSIIDRYLIREIGMTLLATAAGAAGHGPQPSARPVI
ncbi:MAG: hypothetical protein V9H25_08835 [Candidatus Competibacter sp.]